MQAWWAAARSTGVEWYASVVDRLRRRSLDRRYERSLPVALEALARALRGGAPLAPALREAATTVDGLPASDLRNAAADLDQGMATADVFGQWLLRRPLPGVRLAVAALVVGTELGGSRARAVDRVAAGLRGRAAAAREVRALASQARLSALVIAVAPVVFAFLGLAGNRAMAAFLFATPLGWACLVGGVALDGLAAWWMVRIVRAAA
jgi:tight adherence protein B